MMTVVAIIIIVIMLVLQELLPTKASSERLSDNSSLLTLINATSKLLNNSTLYVSQENCPLFQSTYFTKQLPVNVASKMYTNTNIL